MPFAAVSEAPALCCRVQIGPVLPTGGRKREGRVQKRGVLHTGGGNRRVRGAKGGGFAHGGEQCGDAWKTRGRPWPRERVDGACGRRDGAKRKVFQAPPHCSLGWREWKERGRGWKVIWAEPIVITLFTLSRGLERHSWRRSFATLRMTEGGWMSGIRRRGCSQCQGGCRRWDPGRCCTGGTYRRSQGSDLLPG